MFTFKTSVLALAVLASVAAVPVQAAPIATAASVVTFENFQISWVTLNRQVNAATDFRPQPGGGSGLSVTASQQTSANLTGFPGVSQLVSSSVAAPTSSLSSLGTVDPVLNAVAGNTTQRYNVPTLPMVGNFSMSASNDVGAPILNFPATAPVANNADLHNASYASLDSLNGVAGTSTFSRIASTQFFESNVDGDSLRFSFDLGTYVGAFLSSGDAQSASAGWAITFTLQNTTNNTTALFQTFGDAISNNNPGSGVTEVGVGNTGLFGDGSPATVSRAIFSAPIIAGNRYLLTATIDTSTVVERQDVPEPGALALVGLALAALGVTRRYQKRA